MEHPPEEPTKVEITAETGGEPVEVPEEVVKPPKHSAFVEKELDPDLPPPVAMNLLLQNLETLLEKRYPDFATVSQQLFDYAAIASSIDDSTMRTAATLDKLERFIQTADGERRTATTRYTPAARQGEVTTADGVASLFVAAGTDGTWHMPLVNSGFRISVSTPSNEARCLMDERQVSRMGELGRYTYGASYSNSTAYMDGDIFNYILDHVTGHNIEGVNSTDRGTLRKYIDERDFQSLVALIVHASNMDGYNVTVPCVMDNCNHDTVGLITPAHLIKYNDSILTDFQRDIITRPMSQVVSIKDLEKYKEEFGMPAPVVVKHKGVTYTVNLHRATLHDRVRSGSMWCDGINKAVNDFLKRTGSEEADDGKQRLALVERMLNINELSNYLPHIKSIVITKQDEDSGEYIINSTITGVEALHIACKSLIKVPGALEAVLTTLGDMDGDLNPVAIGVPSFRCSGCGKIPQVEFVPVNIKTQFFIRALDRKATAAYLAAK